jgi:hypothetical protein
MVIDACDAGITFCAAVSAENTGDSGDCARKFAVKGWNTSGTLRKAHIMHGMSITTGSNKEIIFRCEGLTICNRCQYKEIPFDRCQRNVKECKRMSHAFESIICPVSPAELEPEEKNIGLRKIREESMRSFNDDL